MQPHRHRRKLIKNVHEPFNESLMLNKCDQNPHRKGTVNPSLAVTLNASSKPLLRQFSSVKLERRKDDEQS